jgi:hypothetical protein
MIQVWASPSPEQDQQFSIVQAVPAQVVASVAVRPSQAIHLVESVEFSIKHFSMLIAVQEVPLYPGLQPLQAVKELYDKQFSTAVVGALHCPASRKDP